jgi:hypothetical protein
MSWLHALVRVIGLLAAAAAVLPGPAGRGVASCWQTVPGPAVPAGESGSLTGVSMAGPSAGWAVGFTLPGTPGANFKPLLAHWDGRRWRATRLPAAAAGDGRLDGVAATSVSNAWAVGATQDADPAFRLLILHWNGRQWARVPAAPVPGYASAELLGVAAGSPSDAWAVGEAENTANQLRTVTEHWNGRTWALVPSPSVGTASVLSAVAITSNHQAWAVGGSFARTSRPFVLRWTGRAWRTAATPPASNASLNSVAAGSPTHVWAVGEAAASRRQVPYALRWNGHTWRSVPVPAGPARDSRQLTSVTVLRGGYLAATGNTLGPATTGALHARWNGHRWSVAAGPLNGASLNAITTGRHNLWAVGAKDQSATRFVPLTQLCRSSSGLRPATPERPPSLTALREGP